MTLGPLKVGFRIPQVSFQLEVDFAPNVEISSSEFLIIKSSR